MAKKQQQITTKLIIKAPSRQTSDVGQWRQALRSADNERTSKLFELYEDLLIDGVLADATDKRIEAITNSDLTFQNKAGQEVEVMTELIDTPAFEELLKLIVKSKFYGRSAFEFDVRNGFEVLEIEGQHINLKKKQILLKPSDMEGIPYEKSPNIVVLGKLRDYGLFLKTAPFAIYKRGGFGDYAQWLEIFGMPQRVGKYNAYDVESRRLLEEAMERAGSAPWIVIPNEANVETVNNTGSGNSGISYNDFRRACNEEMLITIQGQTLTTIAGEKGARSLGEVHQEIAQDKYLSDMRFVKRVLNYTILPILEARGFPVAGGRFLTPKQAEPLQVSQIVQLSTIVDIPQSWLYDKYGIPIPTKNEKLAKAGQQEVEPIAEPKKKEEPTKQKKEEGQKKEEKPIENKDDEEKGFFKKLYHFFVKAPQDGAKKTSLTTRLIDSITGNIRLDDGYSINLQKLFNEAVKEIYGNRGIEVVNEKLFEITNNPLQRSISIEVGKAGEEWGEKNEEFVNELRTNTAVFSAFKNHRQTQAIADLLTDEKGNLRSFRAFKKEALKVSKKYNENWLRTEYNTAVKSARSAVNYRKWLATEHLYPNLEYLESSSNHKRDTHLAYVGTILPIRHKWWDTHLPPSDWNCNCSVRPTDKEPTEVPTEELVNPVFANNPGKTAELVKLKEHPYIKGVCPYFATCKRRKGEGKVGLSDAEPPIIPECAICEVATNYAENQKRIAKNEKKYKKLDEKWEKIFFDKKTGGYLAIDKRRMDILQTGNKKEKNVLKKEIRIATVYAQNGNRMELWEENSRTSIPDGTINDIVMDLKGVTSHNNIVKYAKKAIERQGAEIVLFEFEIMTKKINMELNKLTRIGIKYKYFVKNENKIYGN